MEPPVTARLNPTHPLVRHLVGCWLLNEGAGRVVHDISGYNRNGTFSGEPLWLAGQFGREIQFDGNDDWTTMGDCLNLGLDDVTVLAIIRYSAPNQPDEWGGSHIGAIAGKGYMDGLAKGYGLSVNSTNRLSWQIRDQGAHFTVVSDVPLNDGSTHVAVGVCDRDDSVGVRLYIDGVQQVSVADPTPVAGSDLSGSRAFAIGSRQEQSTGTWFWDFLGSITAVYVWKRVLTEPEIRELQVDPFAMFRSSQLPARFTVPTGAIVGLAGMATGQSASSATVQVTRGMTGSTHATVATSASLGILRSLSGASIAFTTLTATLTEAGIVTLSGTAVGVSSAGAFLGVMARQGHFEDTPQTSRPWLGESLFNGMTPTAFKLGMVLTQGWFWVRKNGCVAIYRGESIDRIDHRNIIQVADAAAKQVLLPPYVSHAPNSTYCYLARRFNGSGYQELTVNGAVMVCMGPDGRLAEPAPNTTRWVKAELTKGQRLRLMWLYSSLGQQTAPERFNIFSDQGTGQIDSAHLIATVPYEGRKVYSWQSSPLDEGYHVFVIAAESATHMGGISSARMVCQVISLIHTPAEILITDVL